MTPDQIYLCSFQQDVRIQKRWRLNDEAVVGQQTISHPRQAKWSQGTPKEKVRLEEKRRGKYDGGLGGAAALQTWR